MEGLIGALGIYIGRYPTVVFGIGCSGVSRHGTCGLCSDLLL